MGRKMNRRRFLQTSAAVGTGVGLGAFGVPNVLADRAPNSKLGVAVIACGGMGGGNPGAAAGERAVALVDVDRKTLDRAKEGIKGRAKDVKAYTDFRKMYDECLKDIDVVLIATPDHTHAPAAMRAIKEGKAVFVQKPLAHDVAECYALMKAAKEKGVLTQMGNQGHFGETHRRACEYIWSGAIGNVKETHTILGRNFGGSGGRPASKPVPENLDWQAWLGPAPYREFHDGLHPFNWRSWRDFGTGTIGDMACHNLDILFTALKIAEAPTFKIECVNKKGGSAEMYSQDNVICWTIPPRAAMTEVKVYAYDNAGMRPDVMKEAEAKYGVKWGEDTLFVGDKGLMKTGGTAGSWELLPKERVKELPEPAKTLPRAHGGPISDLFHCLKNGGKPCSDIVTEAGPLTAFQLTGHLALLAGPGKVLEWDVARMACTNLPEINKHVGRPYRKGWEAYKG